MAQDFTPVSLPYLDKAIEQGCMNLQRIDQEIADLQAERQKTEHGLDGRRRERDLIAAALSAPPVFKRPATETVTPFAEAYPAPWRFSECGTEIQDANGDHVNGVDLDDFDVREFWRGIVEAVNRHGERADVADDGLSVAEVRKLQVQAGELAAALSNLRSAVVTERLAFSRRDDDPDLYRVWLNAFDATSRAEGVAASLLLQVWPA